MWTWTLLILSGMMEPLWAYLLLKSQDFTKPGYVMLGGMVIALEFYLFTWSLRSLPLTLAYGVWISVGAISVFGSAWIFGGEVFSIGKGLSLLLILGGLVGLKMSE